jgi:ATP phosphoribosyltransferase
MKRSASTRAFFLGNKKCESEDTMEKLRMLLPKGHIEDKVMRVLARIGLEFRTSERSYRPVSPDSEIEAKILKPQNIPALVGLGRHDCGFTGLDWIIEQEADVVELLDLGFDRVRIVAAVPEILASSGEWKKRKIVVASEYGKISTDYISRRGLDAVFVRAFGATEALPPDDADMVIDNTATGSTLAQNRLEIVDEIITSTTRFIANRRAMEDPFKKRKLDELVTLMKSTLCADERRLLEMNVPQECFDAIVPNLPCMRAPTVAPLHDNQGYAVKIALPAKDVPKLIPKLLAMGARDILEYRLEKIVTE